jgi:hypothetical protein
MKKYPLVEMANDFSIMDKIEDAVVYYGHP